MSRCLRTGHSEGAGKKGAERSVYLCLAVAMSIEAWLEGELLFSHSGFVFLAAIRAIDLDDAVSTL